MPRAWTLAITFLVASTSFLALAEGAAVTTEPAKLDTALVGASGAMVNGKLYVFGGRDPNDRYSADVRMYDPATGSVTKVARFPDPPGGMAVGGSAGRYSGSAVAHGGKIYYFGGTQIVEADINGDGNPEQIPRAVSDIFEFDPATNSLRKLSDRLPRPTWGMAGAATPSAIYLFGGFTFDYGNLANTGRHDTVLRFDPSRSEGSTDRVKELDAVLPYAVQDAAAATIGSRIFLMGGLSDHDPETNPCPTYTYFDPETNEERVAQIEICITKRIVSFNPTFNNEIVVGVAGDLPYRAQFIHAAVVQDKAYVSGALLSDGTAAASVVEVSIDRTSTPQTRVLAPSLPTGTFGQAVGTDGSTILSAGGRTGGTSQLTDAIVRIDPRPTPPWAPRSATASEIAGGVKLTWEAPTYNGDAAITGYRVYRSPLGGLETQLTETTALSYEDKTLKPGTEYSWRITAVNSAGESTQGAKVSRSSGTAVPGAVAGFKAFPQDNAVVLQWLAPEETGGANLTGYRIVRNGAVIASPPPDTREYVDRDVKNGETYRYQVRAVNVKGEGALSTALTVTPANTPPAPPNLVAEPLTNGGASAVRLSWFAPTGDIDHYVVQRSNHPSLPPTLSHNLTETTFIDNLVERGRTYHYSVFGVNARGEGAPTTTSISLVRKPGAPGDVTAVGLDGEVRITWAAPVDTGDAPESTLRYYVSRQGGGSSRSIIIKTDIEGTSFVDRQVTAGQTYTYTVTTLNPMLSDPSSPSTATPRAIQNKPPIALLSILPPLTNAGDPVELDASQSSDIDGEIRTYTFDFGDGTDPVRTERPTVSHQYSFNGTFTATVVVTDSRGEVSEPAKAQVIVGETVDRNVDTGLPGRVPGANRENTPGSKTPGVPGPAPGLLLAALGAAALALRARHPRE